MTTVQRRLVELLSAMGTEKRVEDVRIGLGYTAVKLDSGAAGVAWTPTSNASSCTHLKAAGSLAGTSASELLAMLNQDVPLARAVGLATANALLAARPQGDVSHTEIIDSLHITEKDHVAMIGYFAPILGRLQKSGCHLDIVELDPERKEGTLSPEEGKAALAACSVAIITGTSLINNTFAQVHAALGSPRAAVLLGPSSPLCLDAFAGSKITHVAGSRVINADGVLRIVSEGGGTMLMKPYLDFQTVTLIPGEEKGQKEKKGPCTGEHCTLQMCRCCKDESHCAVSKCAS